MNDVNNKLIYWLDDYYEQFSSRWDKQKYIWKAVQTFQDNWDLTDPDLPKMIERSTADADYLMNHTRYYPRDMIIGLAKEKPDAIRSMFEELFDEKQNLSSRAIAFSEAADEMRVGCKGKYYSTNHQTMNAVSTYLWLMYPARYYFYKHSVAERVSSYTEISYANLREPEVNKMISEFSMLDQISEELRKEDRFRQLLDERLDDSLYNDDAMHCMAMDFAFYIRPCYEKSRI